MNPKPKRSFGRDAVKALKKASPTILTGIGIVGVVVTAVLTAKATPKALERLEEEKDAKMAENGANLTRMETIAACWTYYVPAATAGIATIGCILGANVLNKRQQASLMGAYAFANRSFREYKNAVKEVFGEEGHKKVLQHIAAEKPTPPAIYGALTGKSFDFGDIDEQTHLFYDSFSQRYFEAKISDVLLAELHTNRNFAINGGEISVKQFYDFLGLETPDELKDHSWFVSDYYYFIDFTHEKIMVDDGMDREPTECWVIDMPYPPTLEPLDDL